jgi:hypothetical protein
MKTKIKQKTIIAWAFMADGNKGKCFIECFDGEVEIYLKKPKPRSNPFNYLDCYPKGRKWKPTKLEIKII